MSQAAPTEASASAQKRYEVLESIAKGGMGEVLVARERAGNVFSRLVVLKAPLPHLCEEEEFMTSFLDEARLTAELRHQNIAQVYDVVDLEGRPCMVMEYLTGYDLNKVLRRAAKDKKAIPVEIGVAVIHGIASALAYAHSAKDHLGQPLGVVHRDISPHNVFLTRDGMVKLIDFGIARSASRLTKTATGVIKGKLAYMAPESLRATATDARADIWALGVVAWELLSQKRLFRRKDVDTIGLVLSAEIASLTEIRPEIAPELDDIVLRMLIRDPEMRTAGASEVLEALSTYTRQRTTTDALGMSRWLSQIIPVTEDVDYARRGVSKTISLGPVPERKGVEDHPTDSPPPSPEATSRTVSLGTPPPTVSMEAPEVADSTVREAPVAVMAPAPPKRQNTPLIAGGVVAFLLLSGIVGATLVYVLSSNDDEASATIVTDQGDPVVRVDGAPPDARVMIDGVHAPTGETRIPADGRLHHVAVLSARGEVLLERRVPVHQDVTVFYAEARAPQMPEDVPSMEVVAHQPTMRRAAETMRSVTRPMEPAMSGTTPMMRRQVGEGELLDF